jgi:hypothetical protein
MNLPRLHPQPHILHQQIPVLAHPEVLSSGVALLAFQVQCANDSVGDAI